MNSSIRCDNAMEEGMFDIIDQAKQMLLDRHQVERDLIYAIAKLSDEDRMGIIIAYQLLLDK